MGMTVVQLQVCARLLLIGAVLDVWMDLLVAAQSCSRTLIIELC